MRYSSYLDAAAAAALLCGKVFQCGYILHPTHILYRSGSTLMTNCAVVPTKRFSFINNFRDRFRTKVAHVLIVSRRVPRAPAQHVGFINTTCNLLIKSLLSTRNRCACVRIAVCRTYPALAFNGHPTRQHTTHTYTYIHSFNPQQANKSEHPHVCLPTPPST